MSNLANNIESYLKRLLDMSPSAVIVLQRKELADRFKCVPSQINYVVSTRFTPERGYLVESKRGGGGYLRLKRLDLNRDKAAKLVEMLKGLTEKGISFQEAVDFADRLIDARIATRREGQLMKAAVCQSVKHIEEDLLCRARSVMLARMLEILLQES